MEYKLTNDLLRSIPAMEIMLNAAWAAEFCTSLGRETVKKTIKDALDEIRGELRGGQKDSTPIEELVAKRTAAKLSLKQSSTLKPVVNATGVIIHTNIGRAPLAKDALDAVTKIAGAYSTLEYDTASGGRGGRNAHVERLLCALSGAEAALVVNNNAAAVLLALSATANGREVIVSAGELVEIGDSFRIPEILSFSGAKMIAVGCTNSTHIKDYSDAITEKTAVLLKVHPSNYRVEGFVKRTQRQELSELASQHGLVFMEDLGSGLLANIAVPYTATGSSEGEIPVQECLNDENCSNVVTFSGDKLLGGPQIGVIAGSKAIINKLKHHQLLRAVRVDKMTLAAFEATLRLYLCGKENEIPIINMINTDKSVLRKRAQRLCSRLKSTTANFDISVVETEDAIGGGAFPTGVLAGYGVAISADHSKDDAEHQGISPVDGGRPYSASKLAASLRGAAVPVISAIRNERVILHMRTLLDGDEKLIAAALLNYGHL
ncbi:MAG: L-seryl-tRNA(Sec) selenium transferase [Termitinemataceae bacterium]|nr:MAG: L-seryl-tRNA(Sec) selenium transferase [Termitinemataceae bacterium]